MGTSRTCARCGCTFPETAPAGECPACLMQQALEEPTLPLLSHVGPPPSHAEIQELFADMEVLELLGRGGMGIVYKARHIDMDRLVAVKLLAPHLATDPTSAERFLREARALARFTHPHIVAVHHVGRSGAVVYIVMEFVDGTSLRDCLRSGKLTAHESLRLVPQICDAIQFAHDHGVIHRDIKPENILIDRAGDVKIVDFGLAKFGDDSAITLTGTDVRMGTHHYMAPEQFTNATGVDHRADIYSLGVMFYEMLTGGLPTPQCAPPSEKAGTDPRLDKVVARSLRDEPDERYQQAGEIKSDLERIAAAPRPRRWLTPATIGSALVGGVLLVGVLFVVVPRAGHNLPPVDPMRGLTPTEILTSPDWEWTAPENLGPGVNTAHDETSPYVSADGLTLMFGSNRPGGQGDIDLWQCRRKSLDEPFSKAENFGPTINSADLDEAPWMSGDGRTLVFVSKRGTRNDWDIWMSRRPSPDAPWGTPENLGPAVNSPRAEFRPWLSADGLTLTFTSLRGQRDGIWVSRRRSADESFGQAAPFNRSNRIFPGNLLWLSRIDSPDDPFRNLTSFGPVVNTDAVEVSPVASTDGRVVYFQSDRPGGFGGTDLWQTRRVPKTRNGKP